jgi:hypothetical protein
MTHESLLNDLWQSTLARLGGNAAVEACAREKGAFARARSVASAADLLRLILAYCMGGMGLRSTSAWAASVGLADLSNVALLKRLRKCGPWMEHLASLLLSSGAQPAAQGRRIRLVDGTTVSKAGREAKNNNGMWRLHCAFDLPAERFSFIALTDEKGGERLDRIPFAKGDIVIADRGFMHPDPLAHVLEQGADVIVRTPWKGARWYGKNGKPFDLPAALAAAETADVIDRPIWVLPKKAAPLPLRLVALRKPKEAAAASRAKARGAAKWKGRAISAGTLIAAEWVILVTSLDAKAFPAKKKSESFTAPAGASKWRSSV